MSGVFEARQTDLRSWLRPSPGMTLADCIAFQSVSFVGLESGHFWRLFARDLKSKHPELSWPHCVVFGRKRGPWALASFHRSQVLAYSARADCVALQPLLTLFHFFSRVGQRFCVFLVDSRWERRFYVFVCFQCLCLVFVVTGYLRDNFCLSILVTMIWVY